MARRPVTRLLGVIVVLLAVTACSASTEEPSDEQAPLADSASSTNTSASTLDPPPPVSPHVKLDLDDLSSFTFDKEKMVLEYQNAQQRLFRKRSVRATQAGCQMLQELAAYLEPVAAKIPKTRKLWPGVEEGESADVDEDKEEEEEDDYADEEEAPVVGSAQVGRPTSETQQPQGADQGTASSNAASTRQPHPPVVTESSIRADPSNPELAAPEGAAPGTDGVAPPPAGNAAPAHQHGSWEQQDLLTQGAAEHRAAAAEDASLVASSPSPEGEDTIRLEREGPDFVQADADLGNAEGHASQLPADGQAVAADAPGDADAAGPGTAAAGGQQAGAEDGAAGVDGAAGADTQQVAGEGSTAINATAAASSDGSNSSTAAAVDDGQAASNSTGVAWLQVGDQVVITGLEVAAAALYDLAVLATTGIAQPHVQRDPLWAHLALHKAAAFNSYEAQMALADRYFFGRGTPEDCEAGLRYAKLAANTLLSITEKDNSHLDPFAPVRLRDRWMRADYVTEEELRNDRALLAMEEDLALRGDPGAQRRVAYRRLVGQGLPVDEGAAFNHFQAAAAQGDPYAIFNLGYMHLQGLHVPPNATKARHYFELAADKRLGAAYNGLGVLHFNGQGVERNLTAAMVYFERGAKLNNSDCLYNLATLFHTVEVNVTKALEYLKLAHELGHWRAGYNLALMHYEPGGLLEGGCRDARDYLLHFVGGKKAWQLEMKWAGKAYDMGDQWGSLVRYMRLAEQGCEEAAANAAWILLQDHTLQRWPQALPAAVRQLKRSASYNTTGSCGSLVQLGNICLEAGGKLAPSPCGPAEAAAYYRKGAEAGCVEAMLSLGWMYWQGRGVDANVTEAWAWYNRAYQNSTVAANGWGPRVALWGFRIAHAASLLLGWGALRALAALLVACHNRAVRGLLWSLEAASEFAEGRFKAGDPQAIQADMDLVMITFLMTALMAVLWLRRQLRERGPEGEGSDPTPATPPPENTEGQAVAGPAPPQHHDAAQGAALAGQMMPQQAQHIPPGIQPGAGGGGGGQGG